MATPELGIHCNAPYISNMDYYVSTAYVTENPKFVYFADVFPRIRIDGSGGNAASRLWALALKAHNPSVYILYCSITNSTDKASNFEVNTLQILSDAQWAQDNLMDEFCLGNENLISSAHGGTHGMLVSTLARSSNVMTATFAAAHGLTTGDYIYVSGASTGNVADSESVETVQCTVVDPTTVTYPSTGADGAATGTIYMDWSALELIRKIKARWVRVQAVFTRGPTEYTESQGHFAGWILLNIPSGNCHIGANAYGGGDNEAAFNAWKLEIDTDFAAFGTKLIITEHNVVQEAPDTRKIRNLIYTQLGFEDAATNEIVRRFNYAKSLGITQIYLFGPWGNGVNWWMAFNFLCNTSPYGWNDPTKRQVVGNLMPVIDRIKNQRVSKVFFGNCGNI